MRPAEPTDGSITRRRELRRELRAWLGTSSDDPPSLEHLLHAARRMGALIDLTSNGRYGLAGWVFQADESKPIEEIQARERGYREERDRATSAVSWPRLAEGVVPKDFPVQPIVADEFGTYQAEKPVTCGTCGRTWDDAVVTSMTPAPSARCPFEAFHEDEELPDPLGGGDPYHDADRR